MTQPAKHTPGPWRSYNMSRNKILKQWHIQRDDCRHDIALVSLDVPVDDRERVANLIAAAPAMYEALSELVKYLREEVADEALDTWEPVFKAAMVLAQAERRQG